MPAAHAPGKSSTDAATDPGPGWALSGPTRGGFLGRPPPWVDFSGPFFRQEHPRRSTARAVVPWQGTAPIQRKCADCAAEGDEVQTKLAVSKPGDPLEREADQFAERVLEGRAADISRAAGPAVQRQVAEEPAPAHQLEAAQQEGATEEESAGEEGDEILPEEREIGMLWPKRDDAAAAAVSAKSIPRGGGQPLAADLRGFMRARTGFDFSNVRVHADSQAAASASRIAARAYTLGNHIYFDEGQYQPASHEGRKLLGHELAHVVQQGETGPTPVIQRQGHQVAAPGRPHVTRIVVRQVGGGAGGQAIAYDGDRVVRTMRITSGRPGHPTAAGDFALGEADPNHRSTIYGNCSGGHGSRPCTSGSVRPGEHFQGTPMPNFRRFNGAIGFHEGSLQTPSHGCIHLSAADSAWVLALPAGTAVHVEAAPVARPPRRRDPGQRRRR
jgi:hypothetical protein